MDKKTGALIEPYMTVQDVCRYLKISDESVYGWIKNTDIPDKISAKKVDKDRKSDVYIVAKDFSWTYVRTHEVDFGPYLCVKKYTNYNLSD